MMFGKWAPGGAYRVDRKLITDYGARVEIGQFDLPGFGGKRKALWTLECYSDEPEAEQAEAIIKFFDRLESGIDGIANLRPLTPGEEMMVYESFDYSELTPDLRPDFVSSPRIRCSFPEPFRVQQLIDVQFSRTQANGANGDLTIDDGPRDVIQVTSLMIQSIRKALKERCGEGNVRSPKHKYYICMMQECKLGFPSV